MALTHKRRMRYYKTLMRWQDSRCAYCLKEVSMAKDGKRGDFDATLDHVLPLSLGGRSTWNNLVIACYRCNQSKKNEMIEPILKPFLQLEESRSDST